MTDKIEIKTEPDGSKHWYQNGERHRTDGPAIEYPNGLKEYWVNGKRHRTDGPAIEYPNGLKEYWINGKELTQFEAFVLFKIKYND